MTPEQTGLYSNAQYDYLKKKKKKKRNCVASNLKLNTRTNK